MRKTGYYDKNNKEYIEGKRVKWQIANDNFPIYGTIVYGKYPIITDHETYRVENIIGFIVKYSDNSGYTLLDEDWQIISEKEFNEYIEKRKVI